MAILVRTNRVPCDPQILLHQAQDDSVPLGASEAGVVLRFSLVELSRRRAVLLRGGPRRKGRVESHVHLPLLSLHFGATHRYHCCAKN